MMSCLSTTRGFWIPTHRIDVISPDPEERDGKWSWTVNMKGRDYYLGWWDSEYDARYEMSKCFTFVTTNNPF